MVKEENCSKFIEEEAQKYIKLFSNVFITDYQSTKFVAIKAAITHLEIVKGNLKVIEHLKNLI